MDDSKPNSKYCKNCGAENLENDKFCKECGQFLQKNANKNTKKGIISNKIFLIAIVAVLIVVIGIGANYAYGNYKMSQMNNYMKQSNNASSEAYSLSNEAQGFVNQSDYNDAITDIDKAVDSMNHAQTLAGQAYGYADGPYKEVITADINYNGVQIDLWNSWKNRLQDIQSSNTIEATELKQQENSRVADQQKYGDQISTTLNQNPGMQEYIQNNW